MVAQVVLILYLHARKWEYLLFISCIQCAQLYALYSMYCCNLFLYM